MPDFAISGDDYRIDDVVAEVEIALALGREQSDEGRDIFCVHLAGVIGEVARDVQWRDDRDVMSDYGLARYGQLAVAALFAGEINDHRSRTHRPHGFRADEHRRRLTRH